MSTIFATDREGREHSIAANPGESVMVNLRDGGGLDIASICGGTCSCGTCHVYVDEDWMDRLPTQAIDEKEILEGSMHVRETSRLSCQIPFTPALDGLRVTLAPED